MNNHALQAKSVVILGAGVAGLCVASELLKIGIVPRIVERQASPGPESCSWWAGGMLAPYCEVESAEPEVLKYGKLAADWWQEQTGLVSRQGSLVLALSRDQSDLQRFAQRTTDYEMLNSDGIKNLEPDLENRFMRGLFYEQEAHLSPRDALLSLKQNLIRNGVEFSYQSGDAEALSKYALVIDCRGIKAKSDIEDLRGVKGEMLVLHCPEVELSRPIRLLHPRIPLYIVPRGDGIYMLGATMIESSAKKHATARSVLELLNAAYALNPAFGEAEILEIGVDSRPAFADNLPSIRLDGNIIRANGLYRHGFLLAPTLATMVASFIQTGVMPPWYKQ